GFGEQEITDYYLRHSSFISMVRIVAGVEGAGEPEGERVDGFPDKGPKRRGCFLPPDWGQRDSGQPDGQKEDDTYGEDDGTSTDSLLGSRYVLGFYVDDEYIHPSSYDRMVKYG